MSTLGDMPASPWRDEDGQGGFTQYPGLTIRQEFAKAAMQGLLADHKDHSDECADGETCPQTTARLAVEHADALLAQLEKKA